MEPESRSAPNPPDIALAPEMPAGLTSAEAQRRRQEFGPNIVEEREEPAWRVYLAKFWAPVPWMLEAAILLQTGLGEFAEAAVIAGLLVFNVTLGLLQESHATSVLAALRRKLAPMAVVRRDGAWVRLPSSEVVPGDAIMLPLGAMVPADARIASGSVMADQSMVTGESVPVEIAAGGLVHAGSLVRRGQALAEVTATGGKTYFGRAVELVRVAHSESTEQRAVFAATRDLAVVNGLVAAALVAFAHAQALPATDLVGLALTALLASIPVALPATFTLSAALGAQRLARRGVLLARLSASHEAAAMDVLCVDKTGTLTVNELRVAEVQAMPGVDRDRVLHLAAFASSAVDQDPIDAAVRAAAGDATSPAAERLVRFVPFDPETRISEAIVADPAGNPLRIVKGAFAAISELASPPGDARRLVDDLSERGHRVIAVAAGPPESLSLVGLIAISDPPRPDSAELVAKLHAVGVRTLMVTGDSPVTAAAIARKVGIADSVCPHEQLSGALSADRFGIVARVVPEQKFALVRALQGAGHVVGMCGDGTNDAPALRQAQIGIAVFSATDVAKAAAGIVLTEPGLAGIVSAIQEGRAGFQRLLTYTLNMLVKKIEIVLFLAAGLILAHRPVMTPVLMVLLLVTNDFLSMSLTTDRAKPSPSPNAWRMRDVAAAAAILAVCKLGFSVAVLGWGEYRAGLGGSALPTLAFVTLVLGNQAVLYALRERRYLWSSRPSAWVVASSVIDVSVALYLSASGTLMEPLPLRIFFLVFAAAAAFAFVLDQIKLRVIPAFGIT